MIEQWMQIVINEKLEGISFERQTVLSDFGAFKKVAVVRNDDWITFFDFNKTDKTCHHVNMKKEEVFRIVDMIRNNHPKTE